MPIFIDLVTTGIKINDRIIKISLITLKNNEIDTVYSKILNPQISFKPFISKINNIEDSQIKSAPTFDQVSNEIYSILNGNTLVSFNNRLNYAIIKSEFKKIGKAIKICPLMIQKYLNPHISTSSSLAELATEYNVSDTDKSLRNIQTLLTAYRSVPSFPQVKNKKTYLPTKISNVVIDEIPNGPGVYIFFNSNNEVIYVGKSIHIKQRVISHFQNDININKEMKISNQIAKIQWIETIGELGALLKETELIKSLKPALNSKLRSINGYYVTTSFKTNGYLSCSSTLNTKISSNELPNVISINSSKMKNITQLENICKSFHLCKKLLGIDKRPNACFGYALGECLGACIAKEDSITYNKRFIKAFEMNRIKKWPYTGPIWLVEKNKKQTTKYYINNWIMAYKRMSNENLTFDYDIYKILVNFIN